MNGMYTMLQNQHKMIQKMIYRLFRNMHFLFMIYERNA